MAPIQWRNRYYSTMLSRLFNSLHKPRNEPKGIGTGAIPPFQMVVVPAHGAPYSVRALKRACWLAGPNAEIRLVYFIEVPRAYALTATLPQEETMAAEVLESGEKDLRETPGVTVTSEIARGRDVVETITRFCEANGADLLVLGSRPDGVRGISLSLAQRIYERAKCAVVHSHIAGER